VESNNTDQLLENASKLDIFYKRNNCCRP